MRTTMFPPEFWTVYDKARELAEQSPIWNNSEMQRMFAIEQSGISDAFEEKLFNAVEMEQLLILFEMYKQMVHSCKLT